jgi:glycosyltransferase involved in cell wall biosynthesis
VTLTALKIQGPFRGISGHDHHTREFVKALLRLGVAIQLVDNPRWGSLRLAEPDPFLEGLSKPVGASVYLRFGMPHQLLVEPGIANVNYTMFEADRIHPSWVAQAQAYDRVIVPNEFCRRLWVRSGAPRSRLRVCPLGLDTELFRSPAEPLPLVTADGRPVASYRTRFLRISEVNLRKNFAGLMRVWQRATAPGDDAILVVKLATDDEGLEAIRRALPGDAAPVLLTSERFTDDEIPRLYATATHYVSLSFGEALDLTMVEAAASGLELVAPWHSAYRDYLDHDTAHLVAAEEVPSDLPPTDDNYVLFRNSRWWKPDEDQAVEIVRAIVSGTAPAKPPPRERILESFGWDAAARRLLELLSELEAPPGRRPRWLRRGSRSREPGEAPALPGSDEAPGSP